MAADQGLIDSVANANHKTVAEMAAWSTAQVMASHAAHITRVQAITEAALQGFTTIHQTIVGKLAQAIIEMDPTEALANAVVGQQGAKVAQTTPPVTP